MKHIFTGGLLLAGLAMLVIACKKDHNVSASVLDGKWKFISQEGHLSDSAFTLADTAIISQDYISNANAGEATFSGQHYTLSNIGFNIDDAMRRIVQANGHADTSWLGGGHAGPDNHTGSLKMLGADSLLFSNNFISTPYAWVVPPPLSTAFTAGRYKIVADTLWLIDHWEVNQPFSTGRDHQRLQHTLRFQRVR